MIKPRRDGLEARRGVTRFAFSSELALVWILMTGSAIRAKRMISNRFSKSGRELGLLHLVAVRARNRGMLLFQRKSAVIKFCRFKAVDVMTAVARLGKLTKVRIFVAIVAL